MNHSLLAADLTTLVQSTGTDAKLSIDSAVSAGATRATYRARLETGCNSQPVIVQVSGPRMAGQPLLTVATEAELIAIARHAGVPVVNVVAAGPVDSTQAALVSHEVSGESIPRRVLRQLDVMGAERDFVRQCAEALGALHSVPDTILPLELHVLDPTKPAMSYLARLEEFLEALPDPYPTFRYGISRLGQALPDQPQGLRLVHGDFRLGNFLVDGGRLAAVLDWELAHAGDPMEDLAWLCLRTWRFGNDDLEVGGFGALSDLRSDYEAAGGEWRSQAFSWWTAARTIWWGIGLASQAARFSSGESTSLVHAASGRRVVELEYDLLKLLGTSDEL